MKLILRLYGILAVMAVFSGCAYFNMYFNAKESYNEAERKRKETNVIDKGLYENSLKELSKILEFYPESRWVDDALLMMGLCYMRQDDHYKARKKFNELLTKFPDSDIADQARIYLAEVEIGLKNYGEAGRLLASIEAGEINIEPFRLLKLNAEMSLSLGDSSKALENMMKAEAKAEAAADKISLLTTAADIAEKINDFKTAAEINLKLSNLYTEREKIFLSKVKYAEAIRNAGETGKAVSILEDITSDAQFALYSLKGDIRLGKLYIDNDMQEKAFEKLDEILRVNPKDRNNGPDLSETAYYFGEYYFMLKKDFKAAEVMYDSSGYFDRRNVFYEKSVVRKNQIRDFRNLRRKVEEFDQKKDSIEAKLERLELKLKQPDITEEGSESVKKEIDTLSKQKKNLTASYVTDKTALAERAQFELNLPDTAAILLEELSGEEKFPHKASKAMISLLLTDSVKYKNFEDSLLTKYPETAGANYIRLMRGIEPVAVIEDSAKYFFNIASGKFIDSLYQEAAAEYLDISKKYDKSPLSPKIMQAAALIYENYLKDYDKAAEIYSEIKEKYSQSEYGRFAARKLKKDGEEIRKEVIKEEKVISEADKWYLMDRRND